MEHYSAMKMEQNIDKQNNLDEFQGNYAEWKKLIPNGHILYVFTCATFLKWHNYKSGEQIVVSRGCEWSGYGRAVPVARKEQQKGSLWWWDCSLSWLYQCKYPDCDIVVELGKGLSSGKTVKHMRSLCIIFYKCMWIYSCLKIRIW